MFRNLSRKIDLFLYRHGAIVIMSTIIVIGLVTMAILRMAAQTMDYNANLAHEVKLMRVRQIADDKRIYELELERAYRQNKVRVE